MNIVLDEAFEEKNGGEKVKLGMVVRTICLTYLSCICLLMSNLDRSFGATPL